MKKLIDLYALYMRYASKKNVAYCVAKSDMNLCRDFVKKYAIGTKQARRAVFSRNFDSVAEILETLQGVD